MGQYSSYYLYQKYEKRGSQDWIPCYPNTYSISGDSTNPMPLSAKSEYDTACGYVPKGSDDYNYEKWEVADGYICDDTTKYARERKYVSDDNVNWIATDIYRRSTTVLAYNSTDCGYDSQLDDYNCSKWEVVSNDYICNEGNKYQKLRKYVRQCENCDSCSSSWYATNIYKQGDIIEYDSTDCGYVIGEVMYRWVNLDPSVMWVCEGTTKYYKQQKQVSYDQGQTWSNLNEFRKGALYESDSEDCGAVLILYRWVESGATYCKNDYITQKYKQQESSDNGATWTDVIPITTKEEVVGGLCVEKYRWVATEIEGCDGCDLGNGIKSLIVGPRKINYQNCSYIVSSFSGICQSSPTDTTVSSRDLLVGRSDYYSSHSGGSSVCLAEGVTHVDMHDKRAISSVVLPSTLTGASFSLCTSLTELILPDGVTTIFGSSSDSMFYHCDSLRTLVIGTGCTYIGDYAFNYCGNLKNLIIKATTPPRLGYYPFTRTPNDLIIYVPSESLELYRNSWGNNYNIQSFN